MKDPTIFLQRLHRLRLHHLPIIVDVFLKIDIGFAMLTFLLVDQCRRNVIPESNHQIRYAEILTCRSMSSQCHPYENRHRVRNAELFTCRTMSSQRHPENRNRVRTAELLTCRSVSSQCHPHKYSSLLLC
eukprot:10951961-Karenia_brevis.AAC.1